MTSKARASVILGLASIGVAVGAAVWAHADSEFWGPWAIACAVLAGTLAAVAGLIWNKWLALPIFAGVAVGTATLIVTFGVSCSRWCQ